MEEGEKMIFERQNMFLALDASDQKGVLSELAKKAKLLGAITNEAYLVNDYLNREQESTTGFGNGVAIPHAKSNNVVRPIILFARLSQPVEWNSLDGKPVDTVISILVPAESSNVHLKLLAALSRQLVHQDFIETLKSGNSDEVFEKISKIVNV